MEPACQPVRQMQTQPVEIPRDMDNLPKEFLNLWKNQEEEEREDFWEEDGDFWTDKEKEEFKRELLRFNKLLLLKEKSEEQDGKQKKIGRTAWKPSEIHVYFAISDMLNHKQMELGLQVYQEMLPLKEGREEGVRAHNKLMAHFRHYFPKYHDYRCSWEPAFKDLYFSWMAGNSYVTFEDIAPFFAMKYTYAKEGVPRFVYEGNPRSLQFYSAKVVKVAGMPVEQKKKRKVAGSSTQWPLQVFGVVAVRDRIDPRRNLMFYRDRDNCQIITEEDPYLILTGPTRAVVMNGDVMIEAELKVKGAVEREDKYLIADGILLPSVSSLDSVELTSPGEWKLDIAVGEVVSCVEATVFIKPIDGTWPIGFCGQFAACTNSKNDELILIQFGSNGVDLNLEQSRHTISAEGSGYLKLSFKAWKGEEVILGEEIFEVKTSGRSFRYHKVRSCNLVVLVIWSRIPPFCGDMLDVSEWERIFCDD